MAIGLSVERVDGTRGHPRPSSALRDVTHWACAFPIFEQLARRDHIEVGIDGIARLTNRISITVAK